MNNSPELNAKILGKISSDFVQVADTIKEAAYVIRKNKFSDYPIFPMCPEQQPIGNLFIEKNSQLFHNKWYYYASFLEDFSERGLIIKVDEFKKNYQNPDEFCCLFVIDKDLINYVYIPYPID